MPNPVRFIVTVAHRNIYALLACKLCTENPFLLKLCYHGGIFSLTFYFQRWRMRAEKRAISLLQYKITLVNDAQRLTTFSRRMFYFPKTASSNDAEARTNVICGIVMICRQELLQIFLGFIPSVLGNCFSLSNRGRSLSKTTIQGALSYMTPCWTSPWVTSFLYSAQYLLNLWPKE